MKLALALLFAMASASPAMLAGQTAGDEPPGSIDNKVDAEPAKPRRYALIVIGLAGDSEHSSRFDRTAGVWQDWLVEQAGVEPTDIQVLGGDQDDDGRTPATSDAIGEAIAELNARLTPADAVWIFWLGHGSEDRRHGWFHLPGPDLSDTDWADLLVDCRAGEQVLWLTHSASGRFVKSMSRPGRIVIAATDAGGEVNETRFPHLLAETMGRDPQPKTVLQLFRRTARRVLESFQDDQLAPTEHATLDDNGDGTGAEVDDLAGASSEKDTAAAEAGTGGQSDASLDGMRAGRTKIRLSVQPPSEKESLE